MVINIYLWQGSEFVLIDNKGYIVLATYPYRSSTGWGWTDEWYYGDLIDLKVVK